MSTRTARARRPITFLFAGAILCVVGLAWADRPPPLPAEENCELWSGGASGNDPTVLVEVSLCPAENNEVSGRLQWSSLRSGWNVRRLEGRWSSGDRRQLTLSDSALLENRPEPGWRFCLIDSYDLQMVRPGRLEGTYASRQCDDNARIWLERREEAPPTAAASPPQQGERPPAEARTPDNRPAETPGPTPLPPPPPPGAEQDCAGCGSATHRPTRGLALFGLVLFALNLRRLLRGSRYRW